MCGAEDEAKKHYRRPSGNKSALLIAGLIAEQRATTHNYQRQLNGMNYLLFEYELSLASLNRARQSTLA
jgi:hypothetical protein